MSDQMETLAVIIGALWVFFKSTSFLFLRRSDHLERLYEALEVGVHVAWVNVIKPWLAKNDGKGPIPPEVRRQAELVAVDVAKNSDKIVARYPQEVISATLKMAVEEAKRRGGK